MLGAHSDFFLKNIEIIRQKSVDTGLFEEKHFFLHFQSTHPDTLLVGSPSPLGSEVTDFFRKSLMDDL